MIGEALAVVFGTSLGIGFGLVWVIGRDKALLKSVLISVCTSAQEKIMSNPALSSAAISFRVLMMSFSAMMDGYTNKNSDSVGVAKLVNGGVLSIPFQYRRSEWKLHVKCDTSKENDETKWLVDGEDFQHCPMLAFTVTVEDLGASEVVVKEEEEVLI